MLGLHACVRACVLMAMVGQIEIMHRPSGRVDDATVCRLCIWQFGPVWAVAMFCTWECFKAGVVSLVAGGWEGVIACPAGCMVLGGLCVRCAFGLRAGPGRP